MPALLFSLVCAVALVALGDLRQAVPEALFVLVAWGVGVSVLPKLAPGPRRVLVAALVLRAVLLFAPPTLSDDLYRYLWEGRFCLMGGNPYLTPPGDPTLLAFPLFADDPIRPLVNHPELSTIYPPVALWLFAVLGKIWYGPASVKVAMGLADAGIAWALATILRGRGRSTAPAWLYALHPLGAVESAGSGHLESAAILCVALGVLAWDRREDVRWGSGVGWAGLGALVKIFPVVLVPTLWSRRPWLLLLVAGVGLLSIWPFLGAGPTLLRGFGAYARDWSFNGSVHALMEPALGAHARPVAVAIGGAICAWAVWRHRDPARVALWAGGAFVLLSPTVHPWYVLWVWVPALLCGVRAWTVLASLVFLAYAALASLDPVTGWIEPLWPRFAIYLPFAAALAWEAWTHFTLPGPWAVRRPP